MNAEIKAQWVAALRSGKYKKGVGYLVNNGRYCCLGVLCELAASADIVAKNPSPATVSKAYLFGESMNIAYLPKEVMEWAGIKDQDPAMSADLEQRHLSDMNDTHYLTFIDIANCIEQSDI